MPSPPTGPTPGGGAVVVEPLVDADADHALSLVEADEAARGASVIDEAELHRLRRLAETGERAAGWQPFVAHVGGIGAGYGGLILDDVARSASGDAATSVHAPDAAAVLRALLDTLAGVTDAAGRRHTQVWVRQVGRSEEAAARAAGFDVERRLGVLGRPLVDVDVDRPAEGWTIRGFRPGEDDEAVVEVLAAAYAGTDEAGWDLAQLRERQSYEWFRPEDLLVAQGPEGRLGGLHWLKRRSDEQGEVYNLAIAPHAQGSGLGAALLTAGLQHLHTHGCLDVILWVDRANDRAVRLYERHGFATRWDDVAFGRTTR